MVESEYGENGNRSSIRNISEKSLTAVSSLDGRLLRAVEICSEDKRGDEHNYQPADHPSGVECIMCGDVGFVDLLQFCSVCKSRAQHLYCMAPNSRGQTAGINSNLRDLSWRCNQCVIDIDVQGTKAGASRIKEDLRIRAPSDCSSPVLRCNVSSTFKSGFDSRFVSFPVTCIRNPDQQTNAAAKRTNLWPVKNELGTKVFSDQNRQQQDGDDFTPSKSNAKRGLNQMWEADSSVTNQSNVQLNPGEIRKGSFVIRRKLDGGPNTRPEFDTARQKVKSKLSLSRVQGSDPSDPADLAPTDARTGLLSKQANISSHDGRRSFRIMHESPTREKTSNSKLLIRRYKSLSELSC
ncbi:unnamed protein product [Sphagnum troendelagicum]